MSEVTVLIVDDDRTIARLCQRLLERASFRVFATLDPLEALRLLESQKIDLLLSDVRMPVMDGFELITQAKNCQPDLPVLVMTGFGSVDTAIQALHRGVDGLILKPFESPSDLVQAVTRVLEESRQKRDAARLQVLRPLFDVSETLLSETSPQLLEKLILNAVMGLFQARHAGIYRVGRDDAELEPVRLVENDVLQLEDSPVQRKLVRQMAFASSSMLVNASGAGDPETQSMLNELCFAGILCASVRRNENRFIFYAARNLKGQSFTEADLEMFAILARQSAVAIENARLYSELIENVRQIEESQRALIQAEKMAAVGRLIASLAHEINNPLQAVRNCLHLAARQDIDPGQRRNYLAMTDSELDRLVNTVRRLLDFSRPGGIEKEPVDVPAMINRIFGLLKPQLQALEIKLYVAYTGYPQPAFGAKDQLQQVFLNLILNAMDAMEEKVGSREIWLDIFFEGRQVRFIVEDSGPGLPIALHERVFEPFISSKKNGTGLGLAVSYGIIENHHGSMSIVAPRHEHGACFEILLPASGEVDDGKNFNC